MDNENLEMVNTTNSWGLENVSFKSTILPTLIGFTTGAAVGVLGVIFVAKPIYKSIKAKKAAKVEASEDKSEDEKSE